MGQPATWEKILLGAAALLILMWFLPGIKASLEHSRRAERKDWRGFLIPLLLVVLFVLFLISMVH